MWWICLWFCLEQSITQKESKYTAVFLSITNEILCVLLLCLLSWLITYAPSFILGKLSLENQTLNQGSQLIYLVISISFKGWSGTTNLYPFDLYYYALFLLLQNLFQSSLHVFQLIYFLTLKHLKFQITYQEIDLLVFLFHALLF